MSTDSPQALVEQAIAWWTTSIIDVQPGHIAIRGLPIQELMGSASFVEMIWLMLRGGRPTTAQLRLLEVALVASVDHGPHAPSIAIARMATTCGVELNSAMASAIGVLGDVHGGAGQQCMELFELVHQEPGSAEHLDSAVEAVLARFIAEHGKIIPGY
ncbi:MAG TPA: citrate/2-methylcitrate synthase, partial [Nitrospiraceae bacterium]|nr:citrate/2-methylcitrate synthase [Nitrospiraceae bacterium]